MLFIIFFICDMSLQFYSTLVNIDTAYFVAYRKGSIWRRIGSQNSYVLRNIIKVLIAPTDRMFSSMT
jgi:hypothetical protein